MIGLGANTYGLVFWGPDVTYVRRVPGHGRRVHPGRQWGRHMGTDERTDREEGRALGGTCRSLSSLGRARFPLPREVRDDTQHALDQHDLAAVMHLVLFHR